MGDAGTVVIGVALKWVDLRPEVDPLTGALHTDDHRFGASAADRAALEGALRLAETWPGTDRATVVVVAAGPPAAEAMLRDAVAVGATRAVRIDVDGDWPSEDVAAALADVFGPCDLVCCGDYSVDRGSGSVPAYLAARLDASQALGLVHVERTGSGELRGTRRLDHGRREVLAIPAPAVVSVEGSSAELRRAGLAAVLEAREVPIEVREGTVGLPPRSRVARRAPYRPRARVLPAPDAALDARGRILSLTGALVERTPPRTVHAESGEAADLVLDQLRAWGYLE